MRPELSVTDAGYMMTQHQFQGEEVSPGASDNAELFISDGKSDITVSLQITIPCILTLGRSTRLTKCIHYSDITFIYADVSKVFLIFLNNY